MDEPDRRTTEDAPGPAVHATAMGFDRVADVYERARPDYPDAAIDAIAARLGAAPGRRILDLGAGTGKLTLPLLGTGCDVVAVEPMPSMRELLQTTVPDEHRDRFEVIDASAEHLPMEDGSVDGVAAAQAFHWFDAVPALAEVHRVLVPGGWFAVVHNRRDLTTAPQAALEDLLRPHRADTPSWVDTSWSTPLEAADGFAPVEMLTFSHRQELDAEGFVGRVASVSFVAKLPDPNRRDVLEAAALLFAMLEHDGVVHLEYVTELRLLHRLDDDPDDEPGVEAESGVEGGLQA